jgi:hypothetical protein
MTPFVKRPPDIRGAKVFIGMPVHGIMQPKTHFCIVQTIAELHRRGVAWCHLPVKGSSIVELARSRVCEEFLKTDSTHLFMLDADQSWHPSVFMRVLSLCMELPVVGVPYPVKSEPPRFYVAYKRGNLEWNAYGCVKITGMGLGFTCVQRKVIEQLAAKAPLLKLPEKEVPIAHIFRQSVEDGAFKGEDMNFFADCRELGYDLWVDPVLRVGHIGDKEYEGDFRDDLR